MFVGREDILMAINKNSQQRQRRYHKRIALVGLGGVGKSQIAIEHTYRIRESAPNIWTFWIHASDTVRFEQGYREIASVAEIPERSDPKTDIFQLVNKWLGDERNGHWVMVLDNADNHNIFFDVSGGNTPLSLASYLPQVSHGSILITSRNKMAARNLVGTYGDVIPVEPMSVDDALTLLQTRIDIDQSSESEARGLVEALEYIPLAITQAGAYIANRTPRIKVSTYLELFQESESNQERLLKYDDAKDLRRDGSIRHPVINTWQISFDQIHRVFPAAADLLALMSMFDRQGIPEDLINQGKNRLTFEDTVAPLVSFSLIRTEIGGQSFEMHRLIQLSIREWLRQQDRFNIWAKHARQVMEAVFPSGDYKTWTTCQMLLPHLKEVMQFLVESEEEDLLNGARISGRCGWYLYLRGKYEEAEAMHRQALTTCEKVLGADHSNTLTSVNNLGLVLENQGKYEEAKVMHQWALTTREKVLGTDHLKTLTSANNLAGVLSSQGKYEEAEAMYRQTLTTYEKVLGADHPGTLIILNNLGEVLNSQGKYEEAEAMHQRALTTREKMLGADHLHTLTSVNNLGLVLYSQGKYEEAEAMHRWALTTCKKLLGADHPNTLRSINNLGGVLDRQGKYEEAEAMHRRALTTREKVLGADHPDTLTSVNNLGGVLNKQGKYEEAEAMHQRALTTYKKVLGADHPDTLMSMWHLSYSWKKKGQDVEALELLQSCIQLQHETLGPIHPHTMSASAMLNNWQVSSQDQESFFRDPPTVPPARH
ncbi:hypothetical protein BGW36DRAFT_448418 [Talaromyces proteolyticus]|uniref:DUF7779 domain-containing protein n=1 Tax=Talaromyces proteolyticus TaxID=1131652 RepID=A0AAD4KWI5_9EURO|nr:uncharacterized protein BGW36DRAFT_448418 [Talaromyces proteolyticus]KAH8698463.1 hypothetical protein BGW36DRAFT_448418 [Talaromyces proteolyticus]